MAVTIKQIHPVFAGEVSGVDLTQADQPRGRGRDRRGHEPVRGPGLPRPEHHRRAAGRLLEELRRARGQDAGPAPSARRRTIGSAPGMADLSNLDKHGKIISADDRQWFFKLGDRLWHSDSSYPRFPPSIRCCRAASCRRGAATPSSPTCARPTTRSTPGPRPRSRTWSASTRCSIRAAPSASPSSRPRRSPVSGRCASGWCASIPRRGRKSLFLSSHAGAIVGWTIPEARAFLRELTEHATQREFVYSHAWRQYDLVIWDNRATMHRACRFDRNEVRDMRRTTLAGDAPTVEQVAA